MGPGFWNNRPKMRRERRTAIGAVTLFLATAWPSAHAQQWDWDELGTCHKPEPLDIFAMRSAILAAVGLSSTAAALVSRDGKTGRLPALGWNSWNEYGCDINETVFLTVAQHIVDLGLKDLGYEYVNIDDCWSDKELRRDNVTKEIIVDKVKFPQGIKHTVDKIHELGLKVGIYSDAGTSTCGGFEGSLGYEEIDAATFAKWGIDYLKYDNCNVPKEWFDDWKYVPELWLGGPPNEDQDNGDPVNSKTGLPAPAGYDWSTSLTAERYRIMRDALLAQERTIQYSLCAWGHAHVEAWGNETGHSWRMWGDIYPEWYGQHQWSWGLMPILNHAAFWSGPDVNGFWGHGDWDMLEVGNGNLTLQESRSHFAFWAALKSPLIIGTKLEGIQPEILQILSTKELVKFNQDPEFGAAAQPYKWGVNPDGAWNITHPAEFWSGASVEGTHVFVLNTLSGTEKKTVAFKDVPGLEAGKKYVVHDMWTGKDLGVFEDEYVVELESHDTAALRINEVKCVKRAARG
ncbi:glycoside hydrolase family 27 protein [Colletotrichum scovillei]|uniref:Alpha-galactosidase n=1 Tax=Colletotrichum scovillei TaxID=1209932 RepID=A0A9P7RFH2_9PEZI|nr:glycoside hydrolase family 27 protein [Colletotrichum scovillei]KAG7075988.1 glycoside hydrolase family 27 protein [Colletotrichum scovillei]KAG7083070.1 glycoside hydrolase family 27 protein [Colletotrichum scovillei]